MCRSKGRHRRQGRRTLSKKRLSETQETRPTERLLSLTVLTPDPNTLGRQKVQPRPKSKDPQPRVHRGLSIIISTWSMIPSFIQTTNSSRIGSSLLALARLMEWTKRKPCVKRFHLHHFPLIFVRSFTTMPPYSSKTVNKLCTDTVMHPKAFK